MTEWWAMTYEIETIAGTPAIRCLLCNRISELAGDVENKYCGRCHVFHETVAEARQLHAEGASHECDEWQTYRGMCAVCGEDTTLAALVRELAAHEHPITMVLRPVSAFQLASLLQLALRHPGVGDDVRRVGVTFIDHVRAYFADAPMVSEVLHQGDDPARDVHATNIHDAQQSTGPFSGVWEPEGSGRVTPRLRLRYRVGPAHVVCRLFTGPEPGALAGGLVFSVEEWPHVLAALASPFVEVIEETEET